jgi:hypothetical protein
MWGPHLRNHDGDIEIEGVVVMTASDYIESTLYHQHEHEMNARNERRRVVLERCGVRPATRLGAPRRGLARAARHWLADLVTHAPARG